MPFLILLSIFPQTIESGWMQFKVRKNLVLLFFFLLFLKSIYLFILHMAFNTSLLFKYVYSPTKICAGVQVVYLKTLQGI